MNFIKNLFSGGQSGDKSLRLYVKPKRCQEIVEVRIDPTRDLSRTDDYDGYWVRKVASATRCPFQAEITLYFDKGKKLIDQQIENGEFTTEEFYLDFLETVKK